MKHRLTLSAATAALLAAPFGLPVRADTTITGHQKSAVTTSTDGNITIQAGGDITLKAALPAVTINSNNFLQNEGSISNANTSNAIGVEVNTSNGNLVNSTGLFNLGAIDLTGSGAGKAAIFIQGGNTFFAPITLETVATTAGSTVTGVSGSSVQIQGDQSNVLTLQQGTTVDGDLVLAGAMGLSPSQNSTVAGNTAMDIEGNLQGNFQIAEGASITSIGNQARGVFLVGPVSPCQNNASLGYACANSGTSLASTGTFMNFGTISVIGQQFTNHRLQNDFESGSAVVIGNSVAGGFFNAGPATGNTSIPTASISGNGDIGGSSSGSVFSPVLLIDPSQSVTGTQLQVRGPALFGPVQSSVDSIDGSPTGYAFINHGAISAQPADPDVSSQAVVIQGSSAANYTCLSASATSCAGVPATAGALVTQGGLLNTGTIRAQSTTRENTTSNISSEALFIGSFTTVPRLDVSGEFISGTTFTPATIAAVVAGPGGGSATGLQIGSQANVPQIDVLQHATIEAAVSTTSLSPDSTFATLTSPFTQQAEAVLDQSGSIRTINNAGAILAVTTVQTAQANAVVVNTSQAINLLAGTSGGTTINNSGIIEGDVLFNSGGGGNALNVGNSGAGPGDASGNADSAITTVQGTAVANSPFAYATVSGHIDSSVSGGPPVTELGLLDFGSGTGNTLHVGGFGYVNDVIEAAPGGVDVQVDNNGELFVGTDAAVPTFNVRNIKVGPGGELGLTVSQFNANSITPVVLATGSANIDPNAKVGLQFGSFISSGTTLASVSAPKPQVITLLSAPGANFAPLVASENPVLETEIPFLFEPSARPLSQGASGANSTLLLSLTPRVPGKTNPVDGVPGLDLSGDALNLFPFTAGALANDPLLGSAIATNLTVYNTNGQPTSGINLAASQQAAKQVFSQFTPDVSGGTRQVAILLTDQETGPTAARQRLLRSYADVAGELTLWSTEFVGFIDNNGRTDPNGTLVNYKDHGFGYAVGMDAGTPAGGWYGGALSVYSGDVGETLPRASLTHEFWYMLTGYTDWRGRHIFLDSTGTVGYGSLNGNRTLAVGDQNRDAVGKRASLMGSLGATTGAFFHYGFLDITPHIAMDGLAMREEGYTENGGGNGLDLQVAPYYANSLRASVGSDFKTGFELFGATISPEARLGYRYDMVGMPVKLKAGFVSTGGLQTPGNVITFVGPDPDTGDAVAGLSLGAGTDTWQLGINYDWIRGNNGSTSEVGTLTLLGRI
ncbi:MAG: autotransporter domain-containing protein [Rhizomicrobium sp.]